MTGFFQTTVWFLIFCISAYGWGRATAAVSDLEPRPWALQMALGIAAILFLGGILNLLGWAHPAALILIVGLGVMFPACAGLRHLKTCRVPSGGRLGGFAGSSWPHRLCVLLVIVFFVTIYVSLALHLLPAHVFNPHDDLQVYLPRLVRMLQTGSVAGNPLGPIGVDSLGGHTFLQAFLLVFAPIWHANAFDAIFCFMLSMLLIIQIGHFSLCPPLWIAAAATLFWFTNPQYVNISSVYSGAVMILGAAFAAMLVDFAKITSPKEARRLVPLALFLAGLLVLKTTFVPFVAAFFASCCLASAHFARNGMIVGRAFAPLGLLTFLAFLPWATLFAPEYAGALELWSESETGGAVAAPADPGEPGWSLLSRSRYGGGLVQYHALAFLTLILGIVALVYLTRVRSAGSGRQSVVLLALCVGASTSYVVNLYAFNPITAIRYSAPVLAASLPAAFLLVAAPSQEVLSRATRAVASGVIVLMMLSLSDVASARLARVDRHRTLVSFPLQDEHLAVSASARSKVTRRATVRAQQRTCPGSTVVAYTATPFHLDHARNRILAVGEPGLLNPWLDLPLDGGPEQLRRYLENLGARYVIWDYSRRHLKEDETHERYIRSPYEVYRRLGARSLWLRRTLDQLMITGPVVYRDDRRVVFDLGTAPAPCSAKPT